ncbi:MAG TPA: D-aminoacyl-tRNA deacylase, partial [Candidatus Cloacimonadota bacterium]|nr:D-aminoacyl-tRNA deacylase [Candidatus Cloacimonadota bacterium]
MRLVVQRVDSARVTVDGKLAGSIKTGLLVFTGFGDMDQPAVIPLMIRKLAGKARDLQAIVTALETAVARR